MLHELYDDMDPDYKSRGFQTRTSLIESINGISPEKEGMNARSVLSSDQIGAVQKIRLRRLALVLDKFIQD